MATNDAWPCSLVSNVGSAYFSVYLEAGPTILLVLLSAMGRLLAHIKYIVCNPEQIYKISQVPETRGLFFQIFLGQKKISAKFSRVCTCKNFQKIPGTGEIRKIFTSTNAGEFG